MSTTILIHDKEELPYQSLSTPKTSNERYEFSEYFQKPSRLNNQPNLVYSPILHCCCFTFFILTIIAISYGGYYFFKPVDQTKESNVTISTFGADPNTSLSSWSDQKLKNHHYKLISAESGVDYDDDDSSDDDDEALNYAIQKIKLKQKLSTTKKSIKAPKLNFPKIHESSGPFGSKIEISDVDGDVHIDGYKF